MIKKAIYGAVAAVACAAGLLCGCYDAGEFLAGSEQFSAEEVKSLVVDVTDRAVEVVSSSDGAVKVEYFASEREYYDITLSPQGELKVELVIERGWAEFIGAKPDAQYRTVKISLPAALKGISISTANEDVTLSGITVSGAAEVSSNGGSVNVSSLSAGSIALSAKNGNISGTVAGSYGDYSIEISIKKGESNLATNRGDGKQLKLDCNNGDINIQFED